MSKKTGLNFFKTAVWLGVLFLGLFPAEVRAQEECTVGVAVTRATKDGRPLLWKNRDTSHSRNAVYLFRSGRFPFLGILNAGDTTQVWMGVNMAGFAIMNAEAKDVEGTCFDAEGFLMKRALSQCATVADFESLLVQTNASGRAVTSNFGVIDAKGHGAFFETGNHSFTRFGATDPALAPEGFLVRANFAFTGTKHGYGFQRYGRAFRLFARAVRERQLNAAYVSQMVSRDIFPEGQTGGEARSFSVASQKIDTRRTINRYRTASAGIFQGVRKKENPCLTTFWVNLGEPVCGISVPLWVASGSVPAALRGPGQPEINRLTRLLWRRIHPDTTKPFLLDVSTLQNAQATGILQETLPVEREIDARTQKALARWRKIGATPEEMTQLQNWAAQRAVRALRRILSK